MTQELWCLDAKNGGSYGDCLRGVAVEHHRFDQECDGCAAAAERFASYGFDTGSGSAAASGSGSGDMIVADTAGGAGAGYSSVAAGKQKMVDPLIDDEGVGDMEGFTGLKVDGAYTGSSSSGGHARGSSSSSRNQRQVRERDREREKLVSGGETHKSKRQRR